MLVGGAVVAVNWRQGFALGRQVVENLMSRTHGVIEESE